MRARTALRRRWFAPLAATVAVALVAAACGSSHHHSAATTAPTTVPATTIAPTTTSAPEAVAPLTGLPEPATQRSEPAVAVKIDNVEGAFPQTGVQFADVVYEEMVEGGLTRLAAVYQSQYPAKVGPVRSGRLTDIAIVDDLNHPVLAFAGANALFLPQLRAQPIADVDIDNHGELFVRQGPHYAPHDLYTSVAADARLDTPSAPPGPLFSFHAGWDLTAVGAGPGTFLALTWPSAAAQWTYNSQTHLWYRLMNGAADDVDTGAQLTAANIIVQAVGYQTVADANESGVLTPIPEGILTGTGTAWVLSGGEEVRGSWTRPSLSSPTVYADSSGHPITLSPGVTWVELIPAGSSPTIK